MTKPRTVSDLNEHIGYWMRLVSNNVSHAFARRLEGKGVTTAEWVLMRVLYEVDALAPSEAADTMAMTRGAISKLADRLVDKKMLQRASNPNDGRAHTLKLTSKGRSLVPELAALADENDATFFSCLNKTERRALETILKKIAESKALRAPPLD